MSRFVPTVSRPGRRALAVMVAILLAATVGVGGCSSQDPAPTAPPTPAAAAVSPVDAAQFLTVAEQQGTMIVDVRTPAEYEAGHVSGAVNIDVEDPSFQTKITELDPSGTYAVYCRSGNRSTVAAEQMAAAGFTSVVNLSGGLADLQAAGAEIVR